MIDDETFEELLARIADKYTAEELIAILGVSIEWLLEITEIRELIMENKHLQDALEHGDW